METRYAVRSVRVSRPWFGTKRFYVPLVGGKPFLDDMQYPAVWGFENEDAAWSACDTHESENREE